MLWCYFDVDVGAASIGDAVATLYLDAALRSERLRPALAPLFHPVYVRMFVVPTGVHRHSHGAVPEPSGCADGHEVRHIGEGEHHLRDAAGGGTSLFVPLPFSSTQYSLTWGSIKLQDSRQEFASLCR